jgi:NADH-quinone oxidoreductase E subunit
MIVANKVSTIRKEDLGGSWYTKLEETLDRYGKDKIALLPCLETIQETSGYIPQAAVRYLSAILDIPVSRIYSVASFYSMLTTIKQGKYVVRVCKSLACDLNSSQDLLPVVENELGIKHGETTEDNLFTLEAVACLGLCDRAPAMMINDKIYGPLTEENIKRIFAGLKVNE